MHGVASGWRGAPLPTLVGGLAGSGQHRNDTLAGRRCSGERCRGVGHGAVARFRGALARA